MKFIIRLLPFPAAFVPMLAFAQTAQGFGQFEDFLQMIIEIINNYLVPLIFAVAFLIFLWGVFKYFIFGAGDESARETGRQYMLYGIIGFVVMVSVWGIVNLISGGLGLEREEIRQIPNAPTRNR